MFSKLFSSKQKYRIRTRYAIFKRRLTEWRDLKKAVAKFAYRVDQPLLLVSQIQRSGGSLLSQLFDGHPECHAHPLELFIGYPTKYYWPEISLNMSPENIFELLFENSMGLLNGYDKTAEPWKIVRGRNRLLFVFLHSVQREVFLKEFSKLPAVISQRDILNCYFTSYFNAWINNANSGGKKKYVTAFTPRLSFLEHNVKKFFEIYPDGRLISIIRDPCGWYASARKHTGKSPGESNYDDFEKGINLWIESTNSAVRNKRNYPEKCFIITFEELVGNTKTTMEMICDRVGLHFDRSMLMPTFNGRAIKANTSFVAREFGILKEAIDRHKWVLDKEASITIRQRTRECYQEALRLKLV
jgi:hypothetical protein